MDNHLFVMRLLARIKQEREDQKDQLAAGYGRDNYEYRVGRLQGYDDVAAWCKEITKAINNGE